DQVQSIGAALERFRKAGKKVIAFADSYSQAQYYLASWADRIYLQPMGAVHLRGFAVFRLYLREMLDRLAVNLHVFRVGTYKSALEPLIRNDMSPEDREANSLWLGNLWTACAADIARNRKLTVENLGENINAQVANLASVNGDRSALALTTGLVDGLKTHQEMEAELKALLGEPDTTDDFAHISFADYQETFTPPHTRAEGKDRLIGIIVAEGNILYGTGTVGQIGSDDLIRQIRKAREDKRVKALVLRISTGGGSALASELIRQELALTKKAGKPVVVSMAAMAASGGYWLSADADLIVASPVTLTGSIGIFGAVPTLERTLERLGVHGDGVGTTAVSHFGNLASAMSSEEQAMFQMDVEQGYRQFLEVVARGRKMEVAAVAKIAEGRVWDGATALRLGLVDRLGNLAEAVAEAARLAKVPAENGYYIELTPTSLRERFQRVDKPVEVLAARLLGPGALAALRQPLSGPVELLLGGADPRALYAHSLLPPPGELLR
ncbi:MAG: signal peptide peptidase SppA, partial [Desulfobulbaceae bacterium]|nr:signal peptide peptidase SppA [Desulfobulbaceae bacterium]